MIGGNCWRGEKEGGKEMTNTVLRCKAVRKFMWTCEKNDFTYSEMALKIQWTLNQNIAH